MVLKIFRHGLDHLLPFIPSSIHIRGFNIQLRCYVWDITEIRCQYPIIISTIEISLSRITLTYLFADIYRSVVIVKEVIHSTYTGICGNPQRIYLGGLCSEVTCSYGTESSSDRPWRAIGHDFSYIQPIFTLKGFRECIRDASDMVLRLPEIGISYLVLWSMLKEIIVAGHDCKNRHHQIYYSFHTFKVYLKVMLSPRTTVLT